MDIDDKQVTYPVRSPLGSYLENDLGYPLRNLMAHNQDICIGLDLSTDHDFIMTFPETDQVQLFDDCVMHKQKRCGIYGYLTLGMGCFDSDCVQLGTFRT